MMNNSVQTRILWIIYCSCIAYSYAEITATLAASIEDNSSCLANGYEVVFTCTLEITNGDSLDEIRIYESNSANDNVNQLFIDVTGSPSAGSLTNAFGSGRASFTYDDASTTLTVTLLSYDHTLDAEYYKCDVVSFNGFQENSLHQLPSPAYDQPSNLAVGFDACEADSVVATVTGNTNTGTDDCGQQIVFQVGGTDATTCTDLSSTCTLATSEYSVGDTITVTVTQFDQTAQPPASCTPDEKSDEIKDDEGLDDWKIALICIGVIAGGGIAGGIITIILFKMKKGCFAKRGSH